jgi:hypothetical protein
MNPPYGRHWNCGLSEELSDLASQSCHTAAPVELSSKTPLGRTL